MQAFELHGVLKAIVAMDVVRQARTLPDGTVMIEVLTDGGRSQVVNVSTTGDKVLVFSEIGAAPDDRVVLSSLLAENMDGCYSRVAVAKDSLVQICRYPIDQLEPKEFALALLEVATYADLYERKYFGGVDRR